MAHPRAASAATADFRVRALGMDDALASTSLIRGDGVGWQQTEEDLRLALTGGNALGVFQDGELVSMAALPTIAPNFGWLAYVATAPTARRRGYARQLVSQLLLSRKQDDFTCGLYGSEMGAPLYRSLGFTERGEARLVELRRRSVELRRRSPRVGVTRPANLVPAAEALPQLQALDAAVYGTDRSALLNRWCQKRPGVGWVILSDDGTKADGFVLGRPIFSSSGGTWVGPLIARDEKAASTLLQAAIDGCEGELVQALLPRWYVYDDRSREWHPPLSDEAASNGEAWALAQQFAFETVGTPSLLMVRSKDEETLPPWGHRLLPEAQAMQTARPFLATGFEFG